MVAPCAATDTVTEPQPVDVQTTGPPSFFPPDQISSTSYVPAARATNSECVAVSPFGFSASIFSMQVASHVTDLLTLKLLRNSIANAPPLIGRPKTIDVCLIFETGFSAVTHMPAAHAEKAARKRECAFRSEVSVTHQLLYPVGRRQHQLATVRQKTFPRAGMHCVGSVDSPPLPLVNCWDGLSYFHVCSGVIGLAHLLSWTVLSCCSSAHSASSLLDADRSCPAAVSDHSLFEFSSGPQLGPVFVHWSYTIVLLHPGTLTHAPVALFASVELAPENTHFWSAGSPPHSATDMSATLAVAPRSWRSSQSAVSSVSAPTSEELSMRRPTTPSASWLRAHRIHD